MSTVSVHPYMATVMDTLPFHSPSPVLDANENGQILHQRQQNVEKIKNPVYHAHSVTLYISGQTLQIC